MSEKHYGKGLGWVAGAVILTFASVFLAGEAIEEGSLELGALSFLFAFFGCGYCFEATYRAGLEKSATL